MNFELLKLSDGEPVRWFVRWYFSNAELNYNNAKSNRYISESLRDENHWTDEPASQHTFCRPKSVCINAWSKLMKIFDLSKYSMNSADWTQSCYRPLHRIPISSTCTAHLSRFSIYLTLEWQRHSSVCPFIRRGAVDICARLHPNSNCWLPRYILPNWLNAKTDFPSAMFVADSNMSIC